VWVCQLTSAFHEQIRYDFFDDASDLLHATVRTLAVLASRITCALAYDDPMSEFFSTLRSIHLLLIAVSLALSSFSLSPRDSELYYTAQLEAESLTKVKFDKFEIAALYAVIRLGDEYMAELRKSKANENAALHIDVASYADADVLMQVTWPLEDQSLVKIRDFIDNFKYKLVPTEVPSDDESWKEIFGDPASKKTARCAVRRPDIEGYSIESCPPLAEPGTLVGIEVYQKNTSETGETATAFGEEVVNLKNYQGNFAQVFEIKIGEKSINYVAPAHFKEPEEPRGNFSCTFMLAQLGNKFLKIGQKTEDQWKTPPSWDAARWQTKTSPCYENPDSERASGSRDYFRKLFPGLSALWSQVANLTPTQAAEQLSIKAMQSRQSLSIGGLTIDERMVAIAGPITVLSVAVYLLVNLIMLRSALSMTSTNSAEQLLFPWFCLHHDRLSRLLTWTTVGLLPVYSVFLIVRMADGHWDWTRVLGLSALCFCVACAFSSLRVIKQIRQLELRARNPM
jgi:hypothetical protein